MRVYYNEWDPKAAAWLRELIRRGCLPEGDVDERSILEVDEVDLWGYDQWHFFCGIGGWPFALQLAGMADVPGIMTGSPPCQPFSSAGLRKGNKDERHLAPKFAQLVGAVRPRLLFGEQVASAAVFGKAAGGDRKRSGAQPEWAWIDDLSDRLEAAHYAVGASDIPAAGVGAPHLRQRTFFCAVDLLKGGVADVIEQGLEGHAGDGDRGGKPGRIEAGSDGSVTSEGSSGGMADSGRAGEAHGGWGAADWLFCRDGKWRPVEPGTFPLVDGVPKGMGRGGDDSSPRIHKEVRSPRLKGYGNAIVPQVAAVFIESVVESLWWVR